MRRKIKRKCLEGKEEVSGERYKTAGRVEWQVEEEEVLGGKSWKRLK